MDTLHSTDFFNYFFDSRSFKSITSNMMAMVMSTIFHTMRPKGILMNGWNKTANAPKVIIRFSFFS